MDGARCKKCGKEFYPTVEHAYKDSYGVYCSWTCFNHRNDGVVTRPPRTKITIPVAQYSLDGYLMAVYPSATEAAKPLNLDPNSIRTACRRARRQVDHWWEYNGYLWRYSE
jgi:hypothetical protein